ncbi:recombinase [Kaistella jeonii]|uniref:Recombinase n=1 Tax=Kaistella jeonii TaxID=266749 RepID=A0A0C1FKH7_9FLAO|nr:recombinase [Kaistella jeonii]KIA88439.1 recombinase [Kaistella jeonii]SFC17078.1 Site-specific recombinase [Kaistella jeonii]VEI95404.1 Site-specific recombinase [Kaistella jeonii]
MPIYSRNKVSFKALLEQYFSFRNETKSLEPLSELIRNLRESDFEDILGFLRVNHDITKNFGYYIRNIFKDKPFNLSLTEANILSENAFYPEFKKRLLNKILPAVENENTVWFLVDSVSVRPLRDLQYFRDLEDEQLTEFFKLLEIDDFITHPNVKLELLFSMNILAWRIIGNAMDVEVVNMAPEYRKFDNPFVALQNELDILNENYKQDPDFDLSSKDEHYKQIKVYLQQGLDFVSLAFKNSAKYGISGKINQSLLKIRQQLDRMGEILAVMVIDDKEEAVLKSKQLFFNILEYKSHKTNLRDLVADSTTLMSHLITNHTAETGTHYITSNRRDYVKMFLKASGGGIIVGCLVVLKLFFGSLSGSDFSHAILYSFNYAMGFIMIYLMSFTLATKQPAMTAATMAKVLSEGENTQKNYVDFAHLVSKVFRTQFIAFMGNVLLSFPVALILIYGLDVLFQQNFAAEKATKLLQDQDPFHSKAIFHACIAGFFLFISGIISGNVANSSVFYHIPKRIAKNPFLNYFLGEKRAKSISEYYSRNWPGIMSNLWFGIFLGITGPIGLFLGLDLDIRHITFAAGNVALGFYGKGFNVDTYTVLLTITTVFIIGFFNFAVSFGLSMVLAFRSRKVNFGEVREIYREIFRYFMRNPLRFFLPIKSEKLDIRAQEMVDNTVSTKSEDQ